MIHSFKKWTIVSLSLITMAASAGQTAAYAQSAAAEPSAAAATTSNETLQNDLAVLYKDLAGIPTYSSSNSGGVSAIGEQAFNVAISPSTTPNIAAARYGKGRVYLAGDDLYFKPSEPSDPDRLKLVRNSLLWLTQDSKTANPGVVDYEDALAGRGRLQMITTSPSGRFQVNPALPIDLKRIDSWSSAELDPARYPVAYVDFPIFQTSDADIPYLEAYVRGGGSIAVAAKGWVLETYASNYLGDSYKGKTASLGVDYPIQRLLNVFGLGLMNNTATKTNGTLPAPTALQANGAHVLTLVSQAKAIEAGTLDIGQVKLGPPGADAKTKLTIMASILGGTVQALTPNSPLYPAIQNDISNLASLSFPLDRSKAPYSSALLAFVLNKTGQEAAPAKSPFADHFPGVVPENAQVVNGKAIEVDFDYPDYGYLRMYRPPGTWISTGLYAPPGKPIVVDVPAGVSGLDVQIGTHTDNLSSKDVWERIPIVTKRQTLAPGANTIQSAYGGLIYFIPTQPKPDTKAIVSVSGGVQAPYFVLGQTSAADWKNTVRRYPAPWAELQGRRAVVTVPSSLIRGLDDPAQLMETWDAMVDHMDVLAGLSPDSPPPHRSPVELPYRYVDDVQITAGSAHAGYPIMFDNWGARLVDVANVRNKGWGIWHETGHEYQPNPWKWSAITEVSVNIYSLYVQEKFGNASNLLSRDAQGRDSYDKAFAYLLSDIPGKTYGNTSQLDLFGQLVLFKQLQLAYGWDFHTALHAYYRELPASELPQTDQQKIDTFVVAASRLSGENLLSFFDKWAVPYTKEAVRAKVQALGLPEPQTPVWTLKETNPLAPPTIELSPAPDETGWNKTDVTVTLVSGGSQTPGVPARSQYRIGDKGTWTNYASPLMIRTDGETVVYARMIDDAGLTSEYVSKTIRIKRPADQTPPVTTDDAKTGWHNAAQTVTLTAADEGSGVAKTFYSVDGAPYAEGRTILIESEGTHTIRYYSVDAAGNEEAARTATVRIDKSGPAVEATVTGSVYQTAPIAIDVHVADPLSGVASAVYELDGAAIGGPIVIEPLTLSVGGHTLRVTAADHAGNTTTKSFAFEVVVGVDQLGDVLRTAGEKGWIANRGVLQSLLAKAEQLRKKQGDNEQALQTLHALENEVNAQAGKQIDAGFASLLLADIRYLESANNR
ncbi:M60 family metallopeptidase [Paenibacillus sp. GYB003]|uniref:M60 family metallopeptidase n=1 Tax=Paenibacillus sp. GYB003 TaxID=2994392 RepID=UPI002F965A0A